jgi:chitodextrinase
MLQVFGLVLQQHAGAWVAVQRSLRASSSLPAPEMIGAQDPGGLGEQVVDPAALARGGGPAQRPRVQRLAPLASAELEWSFEQTVLENRSFDEDGFPLKGWTYVGVEVEETGDGTAVVHDAATDYVEQRFNAPLRREGAEDPSVEMRLRFSKSGDSDNPSVEVAEFRFDDAVTGDAYWLKGPSTETEWKASEVYLEESSPSGSTPIQNPFWVIPPMPGSGRGTLTVRTRFDDGGGAYDALEILRLAVSFLSHSDSDVSGVAQHERGRWTLRGSGRREHKLQTRLGTRVFRRRRAQPRAGVLLAAPGGDAVAGIGAQERALGEAWVREVGQQLGSALRQVDLWSPPGGDPLDAVRTADLQGEQRRYAPVHLKERIGRDVQRLVAAEVRTGGDVSGVAPEWKETNPLSPEVLNEPPVAVFDLEQDGKTIDVDASGSYDEDGTVESYDWQFGDGVGASGPTASHTYSTGSYEVVLTVRDDQEATGTASRTVEVDGAAPQADFTYTTSGNTVTVDASPSTVDPDNEIVRYDWEWEDGSPPTKDGDVEESHDYPSDASDYTVKLTITDSRGNTDSERKFLGG